MRKTVLKKPLSALLCLLLLAAAVFSAVGYAAATTLPPPSEDSEVTKIGEGEKSFSLSVIDKDGNTAEFLVNTDAETVGDALLALGLIEGDDGAWGLYVKKVNGIIADYDVDGSYWAFYEGGKLAPTGADMTKITSGGRYAFKVEKG